MFIECEGKKKAASYKLEAARRNRQQMFPAKQNRL
jgi:hypothetical protein